MDPLSALSVAASIVQFLDFGSKLIRLKKELADNTGGRLEDIRDVSNHLETLSIIKTQLEANAASSPAKDSLQDAQKVNACKYWSN